MTINTALILCAGLGKRLNPLTLNMPKPLLVIDRITILERCIDTIIKLGIKKVLLNTFHLSDQISEFLRNNKFQINIEIIEEKKEILDTGGGILNMMDNSQDSNFIIFNPDTLWNENYVDEISKMQKYYFSKNLDNILLVSNKNLSFDKDLKGDFQFNNKLLTKNENSDSIYIGCQILSKSLFKGYSISSFPISKIWNELLKKNQLNGYESLNKFYHLTNLETFKKLQDL